MPLNKTLYWFSSIEKMGGISFTILSEGNFVSFQGKFLWPGFGENSRVLDWIFRRIDNEDIAEPTAIGYIPKQDCLNLDGLSKTINMTELFSLPKDFWLQEVTSCN